MIRTATDAAHAAHTEEPFRFLLEPSTIAGAGVGCFSNSHIPKQAQLSPGYVENFRKLSEKEIPDEYLKFCVLLRSGLFLSPQNFLRMGVFWYINHARKPNLAFEENRLYTLHRIAPGEELTLYYSDLLTHPKNLLWAKKSDI